MDHSSQQSDDPWRAARRLHNAQVAALITAVALAVPGGAAQQGELVELLIAAQVLYVAAVDAVFSALLAMPGLSAAHKADISDLQSALLPAEKMLLIAQGNIPVLGKHGA